MFCSTTLNTSINTKLLIYKAFLCFKKRRLLIFFANILFILAKNTQEHAAMQRITDAKEK